MKPAPAPLDPAAALIDSDYDSADDSDFDPSSAAAATAAAPGDASDDDDDDDDSASSPGEGDDEDGDAGAKPTPRPRKRKRSLSTSPETASGGTVQTRAQRARGTKSAHPQAARMPSGAVTTDVDALWAEMNSSSARPGPSTATTTATSATTPSTTPATTPTATTTTTTTPTPAETVHPDTGEKMVTITHTYEFAGKTVTEEKLVPASSETARVHFSSTTATASSSSSSSPAAGSRSSTAPARRPPPKKRASAFDSAAASRSTNGSARQAHHCQPAKINTLEKSRMDWAGFVDKEGIGDDLKRWNKGEKGYLDRQAFLGRVDENRDRQWKEAHKK